MLTVARGAMTTGARTPASARPRTTRGPIPASRASSGAGRGEPDLRLLPGGFDVPAPLSLLCGRYRRLLLKAERRVNVQAVLRGWLGRVKAPAGVRVQVDVDPYSFL